MYVHCSDYILTRTLPTPLTQIPLPIHGFRHEDGHTYDVLLAVLDSDYLDLTAWERQTLRRFICVLWAFWGNVQGTHSDMFERIRAGVVSATITSEGAAVPHAGPPMYILPPVPPWSVHEGDAIARSRLIAVHAALARARAYSAAYPPQSVLGEISDLIQEATERLPSVRTPAHCRSRKLTLYVGYFQTQCGHARSAGCSSFGTEPLPHGAPRQSAGQCRDTGSTAGGRCGSHVVTVRPQATTVVGWVHVGGLAAGRSKGGRRSVILPAQSLAKRGNDTLGSGSHDPWQQQDTYESG